MARVLRFDHLLRVIPRDSTPGDCNLTPSHQLCPQGVRITRTEQTRSRKPTLPGAFLCPPHCYTGPRISWQTCSRYSARSAGSRFHIHLHRKAPIPSLRGSVKSRGNPFFLIFHTISVKKRLCFADGYGNMRVLHIRI